MPFYQAGLGDRLEYELTFNDYNKVINATAADSSYVISNICLEFNMVTDSELARQIRQKFTGRMFVLYDWILRRRQIAKNKSDTLWNINLNVPARSMKGVLMLFEDPDRTSSEDFHSPKITKVEDNRRHSESALQPGHAAVPTVGRNQEILRADIQTRQRNRQSSQRLVLQRH